MESLSQTQWDVVIAGTGLAQSLLALSLSRSGKKVLHVDKNPYYGGSEAAFSLQEAQDWALRANQDPDQVFEQAAVDSTESQLSPSRAYTVSLSPQFMHCRSRLLPTLVSSKIYQQLEFQAVGSWFIYQRSGSPAAGQGTEDVAGRLYRVPSSREDVFADESLTVKSKRTLMRFLRHISKTQQQQQQQQHQQHQQQPDAPEGEQEQDDDDQSLPLPEYLSSKFQLSAELHDVLLSLSLSQSPASKTPARFAVPRIQQHLSSIGLFGPGFGSLLAKWGGNAEIAQVACRALAVGGGVYVLNAGVQSMGDPSAESDGRMAVQLTNGENVRTSFVVGSDADLPLPASAPARDGALKQVARCISIVSSPLHSLFPVTAEGGPVPSGAVVVFPARSLGQDDAESPPVYLIAHSSETGECPVGQTVLYGSVAIPGPRGQALLASAVSALLQSASQGEHEANVRLLWTLRYTQTGASDDPDDGRPAIDRRGLPSAVMSFPPSSVDLAFDDRVLDLVEAAWTRVLAGEGRNFMDFVDFDSLSVAVE